MTSIRVTRRPRAPFVPRRTGAPRTMAEATETMRRLFETPFGFEWSPFAGDFFTQPLGMKPPVEVVETAEEFTVTAELPGLEKKDIHVAYEDGMLTIRGEKEETREEKADERRYLLWERSYGSFERSFSIEGVDADKISAEYMNGLLMIHLPKTPVMKSRGREIPIP